eukprot:233913_1
MDHVQNDKVEFELGEILFARVDGTNQPYWPAKVHAIQNQLYTVKLLSPPTHLKKYKSFECTLKQIISWTATKDNQEIEFEDILELYKTENNITEIEESIWNDFWKAAPNGNKQHIEFEKRKQLHKQLQKKREEEQNERQKRLDKEREMQKVYSGHIYDGRFLNNNGEIQGFQLQAGDKIAYYPTCATGNPYIKTKITHIGDLYVVQKRRYIGPISVETKYIAPMFDTEIHKVGIEDEFLFVKLQDCKLIPSEVTDELQQNLQKERAKNDEAMAQNGFMVKVYDY